MFIQRDSIMSVENNKYKCYECSEIFDTTSTIIKHLHNVHKLKEKVNQIKCVNNFKIHVCSRTFLTFDGLRKHLDKCYLNGRKFDEEYTSKIGKSDDSVDLLSEVENLVDCPNLSEELIPEQVESMNSQFDEENYYSLTECEPVTVNLDDDDNTIDCANLIKSKAIAEFNSSFASFAHQISDLHLSNKTNNEIYRLFKDLVNNIQRLNITLLSDGFEADPVQVITASNHFVCDKVEEYSTTYKRTEQYKSNNRFVPPVELSLGVKWERIRDDKLKISIPKLTSCKFQYISIIDTVTTLFKRDDFRKAYIKYNFDENRHTCRNGTYKDFCCGKVFAQNDFFRLHPSAIRIRIANDDFETGNALGSKGTIHKLSAFYFTIENIPPVFRAKLENIFLLCLCYSDDIKTKYTDINDIWHLVHRDIKHLETYGVDIGDGKNLKGTLTHVLFDNLGANQALGFVTSFNSTYFCRVCEMSKSECKVTSCEDSSKIRKINAYNQIIKRIENSKDLDFKESRGIKMKCVLNDLQYFHILTNWSVDIMHDLNEGIIPFAEKFLFSKLIELKLYSIERLNDCVMHFEYGLLNQRNLPSTISLEKAHLHQNAAQNKCLLQHLPFIFWKYRNIEALKDFWDCIGSLLRIFVICYSTEITQKNVDFLRKEIENHLNILIKLKCQLIPKHHFLIHYPRIIEEMGPLIIMCMLRFEAKHKDLKSFMSNSSNWKNITYTIARKHQEYLSLVSQSFTIQIESGSPKKTSRNFNQLHRELFENNNIDNEDLMEVKFIKYCNQYYTESLFLYKPGTFNEICKILKQKDKYYFICLKYKVIEFDRFLNSFEIRNTDQLNYVWIEFEALEHKTVYERKTLNQRLYVICDSLILGNQFKVFE